MNDYLILRLSGPMQAWGLPTYEGLRPSAPFPGRSGLLGLLGACLGLARNNKAALQALADSVRFAVRCDEVTPEGESLRTLAAIDFHTVKDARQGHGSLKSHDTIITRREYLYDACFTVAVWSADNPAYRLDEIHQAVIKPVFTPFLGRRSCPLTRPLFVALSQAETPQAALEKAAPGKGAIYSEFPGEDGAPRINTRDWPLYHLPRQFATHSWYMLPQETLCTSAK